MVGFTEPLLDGYADEHGSEETLLDGDAERSSAEPLLGDGKRKTPAAGDGKMANLVETPGFPTSKAADHHHLPCTGVLRKPLPSGGLSNPKSLVNSSAAVHTEMCTLNAVREHAIIAGRFDTTAASMRNSNDNLGEPLGEIGPGAQWERRKGSVDASIHRANEILWKDDTARSTPVTTPLPTPQGSRRSSAWGIGKGDQLGGKVTGK